MALTYDLTKIRDCGALLDKPGKCFPITEALIWATMAVGIGEITEKTADDFYDRLSIYERLFGPLLRQYDPKGAPKSFIKREDVLRHIGLKTNVYPKQSFAAWRRRMWTQYGQEGWERVIRERSLENKEAE